MTVIVGRPSVNRSSGRRAQVAYVSGSDRDDSVVHVAQGGIPGEYPRSWTQRAAAGHLRCGPDDDRSGQLDDVPEGTPKRQYG